MTKITDEQIHKGVLADEGSGEYCCGIFHVFENTEPHIEWNKENMKNVLCFFPMGSEQ